MIIHGEMVRRSEMFIFSTNNIKYWVCLTSNQYLCVICKAKRGAMQPSILADKTWSNSNCFANTRYSFCVAGCRHWRCCYLNAPRLWIMASLGSVRMWVRLRVSKCWYFYQNLASCCWLWRLARPGWHWATQSDLNSSGSYSWLFLSLYCYNMDRYC